MILNYPAFITQLEALKTLPKEQSMAVARKASLDLLTRIVDKTPVKTGRARGNWQVDINTTNSNETSGPGRDSIGQGASKIKQFKDYGVLYIFNNVPYILELEKGKSPQSPPRNMIRGSILEVEASLSKGLGIGFG